MKKLNARQLRSGEPDDEILKKIKKNPIYIILDNVYDTYNVGSIFRLADAVAAKKIYLCGDTQIPPNPRIKKASINTWKWVKWSYAKTAVEAIEEISKGESLQDLQDCKDSPYKTQIIAIEQHSKSIPLSKFKPEFPAAIVVGNETFGVSKEVLELADEIVELPMFGVNKSLNVMVSLGIVLYRIIEFL